MAGTTAAQAATPAIPVTELLEIADYITKLKGGIAALRAQELTRDRIPMAHDELGSVVAATASATNRIMESAESILALEAKSLDDYRRKVEAHIGDIFEACTFQDVTGQRIRRAIEHLQQVETMLTDLMPEDAIAPHGQRSEQMMPAAINPDLVQDDVDRMFA